MSSSDSTEHDDMLFNMLKECKTLPVFLDHIFGFLQRRTDFYHVTTDPNSPIGLPTGLAESLVRHTYLKWMPKNKDETRILQENEVPEAIVEEEVVMTNEDIGDELVNNIENINIDKNLDAEQPKDESLVNSEQKMNTEFTKSESYNGAVYGNYCWSQSIVDVDITVKVPENISAKYFKVVILANKIAVKMRDTILLEGELCQKCKHNDAVWSLDKKKLQIHIDKLKEMWWDCLVTSEARLDLSKIDCSRPFEDLPEEAQAKIEELGWNQERKRRGLPTSDELAQQELLRKAWNAEGSPFQGPFDPSQVTFH